MDEFCEVCGEESIVGVGQPPRFVCLTHFAEWLQRTADTIRHATEAVE